MSMPFRGCRYEVHSNSRLWSRHRSLAAARKSYREAVNNRRGDHSTGTLVELVDIFAGKPMVLEHEVVHV